MATNAGPSTDPDTSNPRPPARIAIDVPAGDDAKPASKPRKRKHRAGRKKKKKQQQQQRHDGDDGGVTLRPGFSAEHPSFYRSYRNERNLSSASLDSDALLDHREQNPMRVRRNSRAANQLLQTSMSSSYYHNRRRSRVYDNDDDDDDEDLNLRSSDPRAPLLAYTQSPNNLRVSTGYGGVQSSRSSITSHRPATHGQEYDVNNPPSMPGSPVLGVDTPFGDPMEGELERRSTHDGGEFVINMDGSGSDRSESPRTMRGMERRHTFSGDTAQDDVCFPQADISEWASETHDDDFYLSRQLTEGERGRSRRRRRRWPNFEVLEEWAQEENAERKTQRLQAKKVREPQYIDGRLRPKLQQMLFRDAEDEINRFTYFNEQFEATVHAPTISELLQEGQTFRDLFAPDPPILSDSETESEEDDLPTAIPRKPSRVMSERSNISPPSRPGTRNLLQLDGQLTAGGSVKDPTDHSGALTPVHEGSNEGEKPKKYGNPPAFWLDIMCPTDAEMKLLTHVFNLHPLTTEDILMRESREKVELFRHYYFVHYRAFDQDPNSNDYMDPVNFYIIVFKEGIITFHYAPTPHPAHVRRRIRTLNDYVPIDSDWLCYALIDSITDAYQPVVESIEEKVDEIDDAILEMHDTRTGDEDSDDESINEKASIRSRDNNNTTASSRRRRSGGSMLKRVGKIRKKTMNLGRLLSTKADVIKQFAKRCTERYDVAPRSDIGLFLGDIQDHIVTMQSSLTHYEMMLGRAHSNYLAQISFRMNQRQEEASGSLNKLTVLGTIVLPMNIITGMWGMNVTVPGQGQESLFWFFSITAGLFVFGSLCYFAAKKSHVV